ncbi:MAG: hypothetical protein FWC43_13135 [Planctomycetaceae bacterium]|nr:hypothetical protein [Planctomycetaceae bacterium]
MSFIQQALLSVIVEENRWKSELVVATDQIHAADLEELSDWFSERLPDFALRFEMTNLFFHPLPSGNVTLGRMIPNKKDHSFCVHYLIISPQLLLKFANNPIALYQRLRNGNEQLFFHKPPQRLEPIPIQEPVHSIPLVDEQILNRLVDNPGPKATAVLLQTALDSVCTFFVGGPTSLRMLHGLFNLLPLSWRTELTFSTDLHFSRSRPFKLVGIHAEADIFHFLPSDSHSDDHRISFCDLNTLKRPECKNVFLEAWPLLIYHLLQRREFESLQKIYQEDSRSVPGLPTADCPPGSNPEELRILGNRCLRGLFASPQTIETKPVLRKAASVEDANLTPFIFPDFEQTEFQTMELELSELASEEIYRSAYDEDSSVPVPLATMIQKKVVKLNDSGSLLLKRIKKYPNLKNELKWLDSCTARVLLGDSSAQIPFRTCWNNIRERTDAIERLELTEDYLLLIRDFMNSYSLRNEPRLLERDINILELLNVLLE